MGDAIAKRSQNKKFWNIAVDTIKELETENGILASAKEEIFGCIFGRDSLITSLKLLRVEQKTSNGAFLPLVKKVLENLITLQGTEVNIESGEEPGKCIHEYRRDNHEHLTKRAHRPWHVYPDGTMRIYDTVDATPLLLITLYRYWQASGDSAFIEQVMPNINAALTWLFVYGDSNQDGFIDYQLNPLRKAGGLQTQSWMDSGESVFHESGEAVTYPIAPVEAQAYSYLAMKLWAKFFAGTAHGGKWYAFGRRNFAFVDQDKARYLEASAHELKEKFNAKFIVKENFGIGTGRSINDFTGADASRETIHIASGIDGSGKQIKSVRSSMGHVLWAALNKETDNELDGILDQKYVSAVVKRLMQPDLFVESGGIRTLSSKSSKFSVNSYHNGSIWPHDNSVIIEGLENYGYKFEARRVKRALNKAFAYFNTPLELYSYDTDFVEYISDYGQSACKKQAWSTAAMLDLASESKTFSSSIGLSYLDITNYDTFQQTMGLLNKFFNKSLAYSKVPVQIIKERGFYKRAEK